MSTLWQTGMSENILINKPKNNRGINKQWFCGFGFCIYSKQKDGQGEENWGSDYGDQNETVSLISAKLDVELQKKKKWHQVLLDRFLCHLHHSVRKSEFLCVLLVCLHLFALRSLEK